MSDKHYCWNCGIIEIPEPVRCCSGRDCGCMGMPIEPPFCSEKCQKEYAVKIQEECCEKNNTIRRGRV